MPIEVELKFPLSDPDAVLAELFRRGATEAEPLQQSDLYFNHPCRDFAVTDEALRLRASGSSLVLTYKGPVLDRRVKSRAEIELPVGVTINSESADTLATETTGLQRSWEQLLAALGFRPVLTVVKQRRTGSLPVESTVVTWSVDAVPPLGHYLELELITEDETDRLAAQQTLLALARSLSLPEPEQRSYLQLLIDLATQEPA
jgi:adenylate cyclase, class 2